MASYGPVIIKLGLFSFQSSSYWGYIMYSYYQTKAFYGTVIIKLGLFTVQLSSTQSFFCDPEEDVYKGNGHNNGRRVTEP